MKLPKFLRPLVARIAKFLTEVSTVSDESLTPIVLTTAEVPVLLNAAAPAPTAPIPEIVPAPEVRVVPAKDFVEKLETILSALGHELPVFWSEAVALARKAL